MSKMTLDQLLEISREDEPMDDGFVRMVMADIKTEEQRRWRLKLVRRPVVAGVVTAVVAMSGAVAAFVGTHGSPEPQTVATPHGTASVTVSAPPASALTSSLPGPVASVAAPESATPSGLHFGQGPHSAWILDDVSGLKLTTETYGSSFAAGQAHMITLTLLNTSGNALAIEGADGCPLKIVASKDGKPSAPVCAQGTVPQDTFVLAPGGSTTASAKITLPSAGSWSIVGLCPCSYTNTSATAAEAPTSLTTTSSDALGGLLSGQVQLPTLPPIPGKSTPEPGVTRLQTPPVIVEAT